MTLFTTRPPRNPARRAPTAGLTLLEMMVVLAIIALVVGLGAPRLMENFGRAKGQAAGAAMANLKAAVQLYYIDTGRYPSESEGLTALLQAPAGTPGWAGPYLDSATATVDPWGRDYLYRFPGTADDFDLVTLGRDGQPGGSGEDSDITL